MLVYEGEGFKEVCFYGAYKKYDPTQLKKHVKRPAFVAQFIYQWWHAGKRPVTVVKPRSIKVVEMNISGVCLNYPVCSN